MDLKQVVTRLRKENRSLTDAFLWLASGNADWQTLVQSLPQKLCNQLPSTVPGLLTAPKPEDDESSSGLALESAKNLATTRSAPQSPDPPSTPGNPQTPGQLDSRPSSQRMDSQSRQRRTRSKHLQHTSSNGAPGKQPALYTPHVQSRLDKPARRVLERFPELAALESEFQDLVCRPPRTCAHPQRALLCSVFIKYNLL